MRARRKDCLEERMAARSPITRFRSMHLWAHPVARQALLGFTALLLPLFLGLLLAQGLWHLDDALAQRERGVPGAVVD